MYNLEGIILKSHCKNQDGGTHLGGIQTWRGLCGPPGRSGRGPHGRLYAVRGVGGRGSVGRGSRHGHTTGTTRELRRPGCVGHRVASAIE